jgi:hypothetical protein
MDRILAKLSISENKRILLEAKKKPRQVNPSAEAEDGPNEGLDTFIIATRSQ